MADRDTDAVAGQICRALRSTGLVVAASGLLLPRIFDHLPER
jgi:hypothetical protein